MKLSYSKFKKKIIVILGVMLILIVGVGLINTASATWNWRDECADGLPPSDKKNCVRLSSQYDLYDAHWGESACWVNNEDLFIWYRNYGYCEDGDFCIYDFTCYLDEDDYLENSDCKFCEYNYGFNCREERVPVGYGEKTGDAICCFSFQFDDPKNTWYCSYDVDDCVLQSLLMENDVDCGTLYKCDDGTIIKQGQENCPDEPDEPNNGGYTITNLKYNAPLWDYIRLIYHIFVIPQPLLCSPQITDISFTINNPGASREMSIMVVVDNAVNQVHDLYISKGKKEYTRPFDSVFPVGQHTSIMLLAEDGNDFPYPDKILATSDTHINTFASLFQCGWGFYYSYTCDNWFCDEEAHCCGTNYPNYCPEQNICSSRDDCDELIKCGASWRYCTDSEATWYCDNGNFYCCLPDRPNYCVGKGICIPDGRSCDELIRCSAYWRYCTNSEDTGYCDNGNFYCCPPDRPNYCYGKGRCIPEGRSCDELVYCGVFWSYCMNSEHIPHCVDDGFHCCPSDYPNYCPEQNFCTSRDCDNFFYCGEQWRYCTDSEDTGYCDNDVPHCCPSDRPIYCFGKEACIPQGTSCDDLVLCKDNWFIDDCEENGYGDLYCSSDNAYCCPSDKPNRCTLEDQYGYTMDLCVEDCNNKKICYIDIGEIEDIVIVDKDINCNNIVNCDGEYIEYEDCQLPDLVVSKVEKPSILLADQYTTIEFEMQNIKYTDAGSFNPKFPL